MEQRILDEDLIEEMERMDNEPVFLDEDDDIWTRQSEEDELQNWELGFEFGEEAARNDIVRRWNDDDY